MAAESPTNLSVCDLYTIGVGPSSSHTVGPMRAGYRFVQSLIQQNILDAVASVTAELYGSLALTGKGHATDTAVLVGLSGEQPETVDPDAIPMIVAGIEREGTLRLGGKRTIPFAVSKDLVWRFDDVLPGHPNGLRFTVRNAGGEVLCTRDYYSVGGGFVVTEGESEAALTPGRNVFQPYPYNSAAELVAICNRDSLSVAQVMMANEQVWRPESETHAFLDRVRDAMMQCIDRGISQTGILPGGLKVRRRANDLFRELTGRPEAAMKDPLTVLDWVNLYALAVNEENAAGSRVVTAPTNGASGVIPAVLAYYERFCPGATRDGSRTFLMTAAAIGALYKTRASISAAEVGCQGEVGVACSMAAGALTAVLGGTPDQVENAAEIGMEHNLGLTCDPVGGLVQVPCIERNTMGAVKAINAARLALRGDGQHLVSLDKVIETMRQTGLDMQSKYKETSQGGLAVNVVAC
ncbi:L-serine ammonia-lyase [Haematospirillum sp. 15-248]|uniref:L-serine ammonia-lyase n=1 Tax=Haematospirillum sp. 15-248 TaxID=2723107 RepID=UPI0014387E1B|nr:L-serine ammonia-lyase [Haematospirillum sp. 15-248]NKD87999.1 L-serine ammonia-lyase [Haematospirillum sp. 15-248]